MRNETRAAFEQALAGYEARSKAALQDKEDRFTQRRQFEAEYRVARDGVIVPALKQVASELLEPRGWKCEIRTVEKNSEATLEIYRGDMKTVSSGERPLIGFKAEAHTPRISVYTSSYHEGEPASTYPMTELSEEFVHQRVLEFFQRLVSARR
jgi:hypothetical protein